MPSDFKLPRFYPVLDTGFLAARVIAVPVAAEALLDAGVKILQYRHKAAWTNVHFNEAKLIAGLCSQAGVLFVLNDRADFAAILGCALHIGQNDLPPVAARKIVPDVAIGFSTHNGFQLEKGDAEPVQYLSLGPIFSTTSKANPDPVIRVSGLQALRPLTQKPICAIGGITLATAREVLDAGADSVAIISGLVHRSRARPELRQLAEEWLSVVGG